MKIGVAYIDLLNSNKELYSILNICQLIKGVEIGSKNYLKTQSNNSIQYIRVGDLTNSSETYVDVHLCKNFVNNDDILIAFDGAPGRNNFGLNGAYSSGLYKVLCESKLKGFIYFELNSLYNQEIIKNHSQGTTILHASKAIPHLKYCNYTVKELNFFNLLFLQMINLKRKIKKLKLEKQLLLEKYF